jgi:acetyltransferase-like isoleucine patch superfamily enzyme
VRPDTLGLGDGATVARDAVFDITGGQVLVGARAEIGAGCRFHVRSGVVHIGDGARLGERCVILAHAGISVGAGAVLGDDVVLVDFAHRTDDPETPVRHQGLDARPIVIGARAVIGHRAVVERGAAVPAGARVPDGTVRR